MNLLRPGDNCWVVEKATRASLLIDAEVYFASLHRNLAKAERSIFLLGWDFDSRLELIRGDEAKGIGVPTRLAAYLSHLAARRPELEIFILAWDFSSIYLPMRELFQRYKFGRLSQRNLHFAFDGQHPIWSSHHQKIVVIDDTLAYSGGLDLTSSRWDSMAHRAVDPRRANVGGETYPPFHDVQLAVTGAPAARLGRLCRERWRFCQRQPVPELALPFSEERFELGETSRDVAVAISRTMPEFRGRTGIYEVERLFRDLIAQARRYIYIENQYLTATEICELIAARLDEEHGPEVVIILPRDQSDPLSKHTMGVLSYRLIQRLRQSDRHGRLFIAYPEVPGLSEGYENVHSKVMAVDDVVLRIGSANLNNRSMGFDTECDLTLYANGNSSKEEELRRWIARLIGHHFGISAEKTVEIWDQVGGRLLPLLSELGRRSDRKLVEFSRGGEPHSDVLLSRLADVNIADLQRTMEAECEADRLFFRGFGGGPWQFFRNAPLGIMTTVKFAMVAAAWAAPRTEIAVALTMDRIAHAIQLPGRYWLYLLAFAVSGVGLLPVALTVVLVVTVEGRLSWPWLLGGTVLAVMVGYGAGRLAPHRRPDEWPGRWLPMLARKFAKATGATYFWARFYPFAPFALVSFLAGALRSPFSPYAIGSLLGTLPYLISVALIQSALISTLRDPTPTVVTLLVSMLILVVIGLVMIGRRFTRRAAEYGG